MKQIPTAEKFFEQGGTYPELAIRFAKLHVEAALEAAAEKVEHKWDDNENELFDIDKDSILNSYPLDNIK